MATIQFKKSSLYADGTGPRCPKSDTIFAKYEKALDHLTSPKAKSPERNVVTVALFGLGRAGLIHLQNLVANTDYELRYIVEEDEERCLVAKGSWNLTNVIFIPAKESSEVFTDPDVEACLVATPTPTHEAIIVAALRAGKHVFSEKPISEELAGAEECYRVAHESGKILFCGFQRRFDPSLRDIWRRCREGEVGHVQVVKSTSRDCPLPSLGYLRSSSGIFRDTAIHDIDVITWILGELPVKVYAEANAQMPEIAEVGDADNVVITMKFGSGTIGVIDLSRFASFGYDQRLEVFGPDGMIQVENVVPNATVATTKDGMARVPISFSFASRYHMAYRLELENFLEVVRGRQKLGFTGKTMMAVLRIADACRESAKAGSCVELSWTKDQIPDEYVVV